MCNVANGGPEAWRYGLYFFMLLLGRDWSVHSILAFSSMEKNLRIVSRHGESFLDCPVLDSFPRVFVFHTECFQSGWKLICM